MGLFGKNKEKENRKGWRTSAKERLTYAIGYNASTGMSLLLQVQLTTYLLMTGIPLGVSAAVLLVIKVIDALDDMLFGWVIDQFHPERNPKLRKFVGDGRFMPWLKLCWYIMPAAVILLYRIPADMSTFGKCTWFCVFYLLADLGYTIMDVPNQSLLMTMTENSQERDRLILLRSLGQYLILGIVFIGTSVLISRYMGVSIANTVTIFIVVMVLLFLPMLLTVKEHTILDVRKASENEAQGPGAAESGQNLEDTKNILDSLKALLSNRNLLVHYLGYILQNCLATGTAAGMFGAYYLFNNELISMVLMVPTTVVSFVMLLLVPKMAEKHDKNRMRMIFLPFSIVISAAIYFTGYKNLVLYMVLMTLSAIPAGIAGVAGNYLVPKCIEYGKYVTKKDCTGIQFAFTTFAYKIPSAVAGSLGLWVLDLCGWKSVTATSFADIAAQNIQQSAEAIQGLWLITAGLPLVGSVIAYVCYLFYNLRSKDAQIMARCNCGEITREEAESLLSRKY